MCRINRNHQHLDNYLGEFVMSIEAMKQEPVGEIVQAFDDLVAVSIPVMPPVGTKLYTAPPQREWVGLTEEEAVATWFTKTLVARQDIIQFARAIEAKLKEKNAYGWQSVDNPTERLVDYEYDGSAK